MAVQRVPDEMQEYKYIQFIQVNYLQVMDINCKKLFVYSYCILYSYTLILSLLKF